MSSNTTSSRPKPQDLSHHLSRSTRSRQASNIKQFYKYFSIPGIGQLAGGLPNTNYFPYDDLEARVARPDRWEPTPNKPVDPPSASAASSSSGPPASHLVVPKNSNSNDVLKRIDLASALQYGTAQGYPPLYYFIRQFTRDHMHPNVPYDGGPEVILTVGSTDGFSKSIQALNNEWVEGRDPVEEREGLLVEEYAYMNAVQTARPRGMNIAPVAIDGEGMLASGKGGLEDVLSNWDSSKGKRPHLMYTVTIGQNPTSGTLSLQRRREIYALCQEYDVIIIEDDPYWYLQYPSSRPSSSPTPALPPGWRSSGFPFLDSMVPSYLSIDIDGRVIRLDTFSKTVAPGCRLGWITAQPALVERILRITETSTQQPSGFVQSMIAELLMGPPKGDHVGRGGAKDGGGWKVDGWVRWLEGLRGQYERRMNRMCDILDGAKEFVKSGRRNSLAALTADLAVGEEDEAADDWAVVEKTRIYDFERPRGGMFVWIRFDFSSHPLAKSVPLPRLARALWILWTTKPYLVLVSPGTIFAPTDEIRERDAWQCFRLCFAACDPDQLEPITSRFVKGAQAFWRIRRKEKIDELLKDDPSVVEESVGGEGAGMEMGSLMGVC